MEEKQYKKFYRKADKHLNGKFKAEHGKRNNHKKASRLGTYIFWYCFSK